MIIKFLNTITHEEYPCELPDSMVENIDHTFAYINDTIYGFFSTIPEELKDQEECKKEVKDKLFPVLRFSYFNYKLPIDIPSNFDEKFDQVLDNLLQKKYPEIYQRIERNKNNFYGECRALFLAYVFDNVQKEEKALKSHRKDECFCKDYALRIIDMFKNLSLDEIPSIEIFSATLSKLDQEMLIDDRRKAGYRLILAGLANTISKLTSIFITNPGEKPINLVNAFREAVTTPGEIAAGVNGTNNSDKTNYIEKIKVIIDESIQYFEKILTDIDTAIETIKKVDSCKSIAYLKMEQQFVSAFIDATMSFLNKYKEESDEKTKAGIIASYGKVSTEFTSAIDTLLVSFDCTPNDDNPLQDNVVAIWKMIGDAIETKSPTWYFELTKQFMDNWNSLFGSLEPETKPDEEKKES